MAIPRGIRNNNPLNIRRTGKDQWKGQVEREQSDARISSAEREDGRPQVNGTSSLDYFAMLRGWEFLDEPSVASAERCRA